MINISNDFRKFATSNGVSSSVFDDYSKKVNNSLTPQILEERQMNVIGLDIYSRLLFDRILWFGNEFNKDTCNLASAELLYLSSNGNTDINIYVNSPGGSVIDGLGLIDTIDFIKSGGIDVSTTCFGLAASMGAVLLSNGTKGKRYVLPHSRVMIHQVSSGMKGTYEDMKREFEQTRRCEEDVYNILATNMDKTYEEVEQLCDRNNWFIGQEAIDLGIADKILSKKN